MPLTDAEIKNNSTSVQEFAERYFTEVIQKHRKNPIQLRRYLQNEIYPAFGTKAANVNYKMWRDAVRR